MAGVGDFDFRQVVYRWVVDRGIKVFGRSTTSTIRLYDTSSRPPRVSLEACGQGSTPEPSLQTDAMPQQQEHHKGGGSPPSWLIEHGTVWKQKSRQPWVKT
jgi:hypothetical protein